MRNVTIAAIDIGSHAVRLLIAEVLADRKGRPRLIKRCRHRVPLALGPQVFPSGQIPEAQAAALTSLLKEWSRLTSHYRVSSIAACATAAFREAANATALTEKIAAATGITIEILSGKQEAALIAGYHLARRPQKDTARIYIDVGGGSTEVSLYQQGRCTAACSFGLGSLRPGSGDGETGASDGLHSFLNTYAAIHPLEAYATGGNIRKVCKLAGKKKNATLSYAELHAWYERLRALDTAGRIARLGLKPSRAAVIVPALAIYCRCMEWSGLQQLTVPPCSLADGIIYARYQALSGA